MQKPSLFQSYVSTAEHLIGDYDGSIPLNDFLKKYFAQHKKYGGRDRRQITHLCYCYYRTALALKGADTREKIIQALFLCSDNPNTLLAHLQPEWNEKASLSINEKQLLMDTVFSAAAIFPFSDELSGDTGIKAFYASMLVKPDIFLRLRPGKKKQVLKLLENQVEYTLIGDNCVVLSNSANIEEILTLNRDAVVQDYSSQRVGEFLQTISDLSFTNSGHQTPVHSKHPPKVNAAQSSSFSVWDCCAASGGKSIMAYDCLQNIDLTVSDIRPSILQNLYKRFKEAGIKNYSSFIADLSMSNHQLSANTFDLIICDVPCTGSGTWARTPEQLYFFNKEKIQYYSSLQKKIVQNTVPCVKKGGYFLYITCSVFREENESIAAFIQQEFGLELVKQELLTGYAVKADTMFASLWRKEN